MIISVGYRIKSQRGTQFRIWANKILKDYLIKGYAVNQEKLEVEHLSKYSNQVFEHTFYSRRKSKNILSEMQRVSVSFFVF